MIQKDWNEPGRYQPQASGLGNPGYGVSQIPFAQVPHMMGMQPQPIHPWNLQFCQIPQVIGHPQIGHPFIGSTIPQVVPGIHPMHAATMMQIPQQYSQPIIQNTIPQLMPISGVQPQVVFTTSIPAYGSVPVGYGQAPIAFQQPFINPYPMMSGQTIGNIGYGVTPFPMTSF